MSEVLFKPASLKQAMFLQSDADVIVYGGSAGCTVASAEYMSEDGWKKISEYAGGKVAQYNPDNQSVEWVQPLEYIKKPCTSFKRMQARGLDFILTPEHRVPYFNDHAKDKVKVLTFEEVCRRHEKSATKGWTGAIKTTYKTSGEGFYLDGELVSDDMLRLQVAIQADGSIKGLQTFIRFSKHRKDKRLKDILDRLGIPYDRKVSDVERYLSGTHYEYKFRIPHSFKLFSGDWYKCNQQQLEAIIDEVGHWDGTFVEGQKHTTIRYSSCVKPNVDFLQFAFHACGYNTSIYFDKRSETRENSNDHWQLNATLTGGGFRRFANKDGKCAIEDYPSEDGFKYCFSVPSTFFLMRQNDKVFITGNSGKSYTSLMRIIRWLHDPNTAAYVFRKNATDMKGGGGLFEEAVNMFTTYNPKAEFTKSPMQIKMPHPSGDKRKHGATISFIGMDGGAGRQAIQGKQITCAMVDEATHLTLGDIEWIISRLRTQAKEKDGVTPVKPSIWLTCNPEPDCYIHEWLRDYYLYPKGTVIDGVLVEGRPIPERNGHYRYYLKIGNDFVWSNDRDELYNTYHHMYPPDPITGENTCKPVKFQFIGATCYDNPPLLKSDPTYINKLMNLGRIDKERLLFGSWEAREEAGGYFKRHWTPIVTGVDESEVKMRVRCWDLAGSVPTEANPYPDWTVGVLMAKLASGIYVVEHVERIQQRAGEVENYIMEVTRKDREMYGGKYKAYLPQDLGAAGLTARHYYAKMFRDKGIPIYFSKVSTQSGKMKNFEPFAASSENGLVQVVKGDWNNAFFSELEAFDGTRSSSNRKDDIVDATSLSFNVLTTGKELPKINAHKLRMS